MHTIILQRPFLSAVTVGDTFGKVSFLLSMSLDPQVLDSRYVKALTC
jgi:hypothetical protein